MSLASFEPPAPPPGDTPPPFLALPPLTAALLAAMVLIQLAIAAFLDDGATFALFYRFGFVPGLYTGGNPLPWSACLAPVTYMFLHGGWAHLAINGAMLAAFGAGIERWIGPLRMLLLFLLCGLCAAAVQFFFDPGSTVPVVGASGAISGLFAAAIVMLRETADPRTGGLRLWPFVSLWILIAILGGWIGGPDGSAVAWEAHIGGFLSGFALIRLVRPS